MKTTHTQHTLTAKRRWREKKKQKTLFFSCLLRPRLVHPTYTEGCRLAVKLDGGDNTRTGTHTPIEKIVYLGEKICEDGSVENKTNHRAAASARQLPAQLPGDERPAERPPWSQGTTPLSRSRGDPSLRVRHVKPEDNPRQQTSGSSTPLHSSLLHTVGWEKRERTDRLMSFA